MNAILMLKRCFGRVLLVRNNLSFPANYYLDAPELLEIGAPCESNLAATRNAFWKLARFIRYAWALRRQLARGRYRLVVLHDYLALLAFYLVRRVAKFRGLVWFNSYDAIDLEHAPPRRFSLMRLVIARHEALFSELDFFSLPTSERKLYYPVHRVKRETFVIPNYPAISFFRQFHRPGASQSAIRLIYQGALGRGHGFEEIISLLAEPVGGKSMQLVLKGWIHDNYKRELVELAAHCGASEKLFFESFGPYPEVAKLAASCTIGLAIFTANDIMNQTLATASNKIYEYAAVGLPVILFDTPYFREHFRHREWTFFTSLSGDSLRRTIETVLSRYDAAMSAAMGDFQREFNYERVFTPALRSVVDALTESVDEP